jgi:ribonucleoside-diphosphate reductase alpha chain
VNLYQQIIHKTRYARYLPDKERRETWEETVQRYIDFWGDTLDTEEKSNLSNAILNLEVMPSMRCLMTAGPALERDNVAGFNCSYIPIDHPRALDELMYILMCGTGVGFSVERQYIQKLPEVPEDFHPTDTAIVVADSKIGWSKAYRQLLSLLWAGEVPEWDMSRVRSAGAPLRTFGGRASGPAPLKDLFRFTTEVFKGAAGRRLTSLECHDLCCKIAEVIVVGGVRRSALISLSNPSDDRLRGAKTGQWHLDNAQRGLANNSACYTDRPEFDFFMNEMVALYESKSGERGIFSRVAAQEIAERNGRRDHAQHFGTNPCSEIILRPNQFCNLSEVVVRSEDTLKTLKDKVAKATILGTLQATLTDFRYLRKIWKTNTEEEALLGVSLTGIMDHQVMSGIDKPGKLENWLEALRDVAIETNKEWSERLGIKQSTAITCVKPSGTVSQLVDSASGIHPRYSPYYLRRVRMDDKDPMVEVLQEAGIPMEDDECIFRFPMKSPDGAICAGEMGALDQLRLWKIYQDHWCEHKPSITVYYSDDEFFDVCSWVWKNFDSMSGIALLPLLDHSYSNPPYEALDFKTWQELDCMAPTDDAINWSTIKEESDMTEGAQTLACVGTACEL